MQQKWISETLISLAFTHLKALEWLEVVELATVLPIKCLFDIRLCHLAFLLPFELALLVLGEYCLHLVVDVGWQQRHLDGL